jgi:hypothetical protein
MNRNTRQAPPTAPTAAQAPDAGATKYAIHMAALAGSGRDTSFVISSRLCGRCASCMKHSAADGPVWSRSAQDLMKQIASSCSKEPAYLLPGTPISEAVFRLMLASNNKPMTVQEVQGGLTQAWASVIYLKNLSDDVVQRMLSQPNEYFIGAVEQA